ncbi:hypothetical protein O181_075848 [Austropuccinia psidii MF-1]|uniref:Integrase catalytic domain-containing protein n=1 Tax=Austropuccinia psidii MF-1 TaxID=1389203 RepID=A0A9Q3F9P4_9BASI|nr:hypothetical protein [Austropuccinia psidii MF-1]
MFGHVAMKRIRSFIRQRYSDSLLLNKKTSNCASCQISKSERRSRLLPGHAKAEPMDIISMDLMGPYNLSVNGGSWLMTVRDAGSTYGECHILKRKSDATSLAIELVTRWERQSGRAAKILHTNGSGEFKNDTLKKWCNANGIVHEFSLPYFHEQNGLAEHFNRSVADIGRTIFWSSQLPRTFWGFAFIWAAFTVNEIPKSLTNGRTPSDMLFGWSAGIDRLRIFGETAFVHIPSECGHKLDAHAVQARAVAYLPDYKGWLFWIEATSTFVKSAWATFPRSDKVTISLSNMMKRSLKDHPPQHNNKLEDRAAEPLNANLSLPKSFKQAMSSTDRNKWSHAIRMELSNMKDMGVFEVTPIPPGQCVLGGGWVFAVKSYPTGGQWFKARYVAQGNLQRPALDFADTFAPTASFTSLRLVLTLSAKNSWLVSTFDFVAAYLNAPIDETLWIRPPEGLHIPLGHGCLLNKALYGTRQAGRLCMGACGQQHGRGQGQVNNGWYQGCTGCVVPAEMEGWHLFNSWYTCVPNTWRVLPLPKRGHQRHFEQALEWTVEPQNPPFLLTLPYRLFQTHTTLFATTNSSQSLVPSAMSSMPPGLTCVLLSTCSQDIRRIPAQGIGKLYNTCWATSSTQQTMVSAYALIH